jgi:hypothetical protein
MKTFILALGIALAAPVFAVGQSDAAKDVDDKVKDAVDTAKDKLGTDSGTAKAGRHIDRAVRTVKHKARHAKKAVKEEIHEATKPAP